jgi:osmotically inducible lipoprotein OsmB
MKRVIIICVAALLLTSCGTAPGDRGLSGAGIGAGTGAVIGMLIGGPLAGTAIGAIVGAGAGVLIPPSKLNLGKPVWR